MPLCQVRPYRPTINPKVSWANFRQLADVNERKDQQKRRKQERRIKNKVEGNVLRTLVNELNRLMETRANCGGKGRRARSHAAEF